MDQAKQKPPKFLVELVEREDAINRVVLESYSRNNNEDENEYS